jgi:hypothetical protein
MLDMYIDLVLIKVFGSENKRSKNYFQGSLKSGFL